MVSKKTIELVKSTAPVLEQQGQAITKVFYTLLFNNHPELKDMFNMSNQKKGVQQIALANAVFKYASYIDQLEMMGDAVETIVQKHVSLSVPKEAYPIIGANLLKAIQQVLGDAATPEIMNAWEEAYGHLANIFIKLEEDVYAEREKYTGGFRGMKEFEIVKKVQESEVVTSFYLKRTDGETAPYFVPGQYVAITISIPNTTHKHTRTYSLSDSNNKDYLRISVKKEEGNPDGIVSNYLHANIVVGDTIMVGMPSGEFILKENTKPLVLIGGGIGITPVLSMFKEAVKNNHQDVTLIQCALNSDTIAFKDEINDLVNENAKSVVVYSNPLKKDILGKNHDFEGFLTKNILDDLNINYESDFYFCGPTPFMANLLSILNDCKVNSENINYEFFGPTEELTLTT